MRVENAQGGDATERETTPYIIIIIIKMMILARMMRKNTVDGKTNSISISKFEQRGGESIQESKVPSDFSDNQRIIQQ